MESTIMRKRNEIPPQMPPAGWWARLGPIMINQEGTNKCTAKWKEQTSVLQNGMSEKCTAKWNEQKVYCKMEWAKSVLQNGMSEKCTAKMEGTNKCTAKWNERKVYCKMEWAKSVLQNGMSEKCTAKWNERKVYCKMEWGKSVLHKWLKWCTQLCYLNSIEIYCWFDQFLTNIWQIFRLSTIACLGKTDVAQW